MNYAQMRKFDIANGVGIRTSLFVSGCTHHCPGCFNESYQDFKAGMPWTKEAEEQFISYAKDPNVHGITILGGEPFDQIEDEDLLLLLKRLKSETAHTIWIYSGYTFEEIQSHKGRLALLEYCDILVDGRFIEALKDITLQFRGSSNQRIIDVQASLKIGQAVILDC